MGFLCMWHTSQSTLNTDIAAYGGLVGSKLLQETDSGPYCKQAEITPKIVCSRQRWWHSGHGES